MKGKCLGRTHTYRARGENTGESRGGGGEGSGRESERRDRRMIQTANGKLASRSADRERER